MRDVPLLAACLEHLRRLPFVKAADVAVRGAEPIRGWKVDAVLRLQLADGSEREAVADVKTTNLGYGLAEAVRARALELPGWPVFVMAPHITTGVGKHLADANINYVDAAGNCRVNIEDRYVATIEGRRPPRHGPGRRGVGAAGYQVLFALLAQEGAASRTVREIAAAAGVAVGTVANTLERLAATGLLLGARRERIIRDRETLVEQWAHGYEVKVRPKWVVGRYRTREQDPRALETQIENLFHDLNEDLCWGWGGGTAAMRLTDYYKGAVTTLHVLDPIRDLPRRLKALPARDGNLVVVEAPTERFLEGPLPNVAHPLMVYAELLTTHDERAAEAATELRHRFLT